MEIIDDDSASNISDITDIGEWEDEEVQELHVKFNFNRIRQILIRIEEINTLYLNSYMGIDQEITTNQENIIDDSVSIKSSDSTIVYKMEFNNFKNNKNIITKVKEILGI